MSAHMKTDWELDWSFLTLRSFWMDFTVATITEGHFSFSFMYVVKEMEAYWKVGEQGLILGVPAEAKANSTCGTGSIF